MMIFLIPWLVVFIWFVRKCGPILYVDGKIDFDELKTRLFVGASLSLLFCGAIFLLIGVIGFMEPRIIPKVYRPPFTKMHEEIADKISKTINEIW
jgi:hypothetical protein